MNKPREEEKCVTTHVVCKTRLDKEGGASRCCRCVPHKDCDLMKEEEKEIRANMKQVDENIYDILVEFMATRPDRDYSLEAHSTKEEIAEGREKNIEHIKNFIPSIKDLISQACSSQLKEVEERIFQDVNIPAEVCKYIREKILAEVEKLV